MAKDSAIMLLSAKLAWAEQERDLLKIVVEMAFRRGYQHGYLHAVYDRPHSDEDQQMYHAETTLYEWRYMDETLRDALEKAIDNNNGSYDESPYLPKLLPPLMKIDPRKKCLRSYRRSLSDETCADCAARESV